MKALSLVSCLAYDPVATKHDTTAPEEPTPARVASTGIQTAQRSFALATANSNPQGLADPAIPFNIGDIVSGATTLAGEQVEYTFNATAGQTLYFDVSNTNPFQLNWKVTIQMVRLCLSMDSWMIKMPRSCHRAALTH